MEHVDKVFFRPSGGPISQLIMATFPIFVLLIILLFMAWRRSQNIPYVESEYANAEEITAGYQAELDALALLQEIFYVFMGFCLFWTYIAVNLTCFMRKRHNLVRKFLSEGTSQLGDAFYLGKKCCFGHKGEVIYAHPTSRYPIYYRRSVVVHDRYSKEKTTLLLLPDEPKSGHVKSDIEEEVKRIDQNARKMSQIRILSWFWSVFTYVAPVLILYVMRKGNKEFGYFEETKRMYLILGAGVIPFVSFWGNYIAWARYKYWMTRGDARAADDGDYMEWTDVKGIDYEANDYRPPSPKVTGMDRRGSDSPVMVDYESE